MTYPKLRGAIRAEFGTQAAFAKAMDMHPATLSSKLRGATEWTRTEIEKAAQLLKIPLGEVVAYFFTH